MDIPTIVVLCCFLLGAIATNLAIQKRRSRAAHVVLAALLLLPAGFCVFGFIATFEPMDPARQLSFRIGYAVFGVCLALTSGLLLVRRPLRKGQESEDAPPSRSPSSTALLFVGVICLTIGLMPNGKKYTDSTTDERVTRWRLGLEFSPLFEYTKRESDTGMRIESGLRILSWSWLPIFAGGALLEMRRQRILSAPPVSDGS